MNFMETAMTPAELKTIRESISLTVGWCAKNIGDVQERTWRYWENGTAAIQEDVEKKINGK